MENEEQMDRAEQSPAPEDAFVAGMDSTGETRTEGTVPLSDEARQQGQSPGPGDEDREENALEETPAAQDAAQGPGTEEPPAETPLPDPAYAADTPAARTQRLQGVDEFARTFPEAYRRAREDPATIPDSVWQAVGQGMSLTAAYAQHAVGQAAGDAQTARQNHKNAQRSTGSMRSAGSDVNARDAFLAGFDL